VTFVRRWIQIYRVHPREHTESSSPLSGSASWLSHRADVRKH